MNVSELSSKELTELLKQKKAEERQQALQRRDAYEGIRADLLFRMEQKVRQTIAELGGTMPEDLPTPEKSIKQIESEQKKRLK